MEWIDLRSDTITKPTPEMWEAISQAEVGDDVYGEDPSVNQLELMSAELLGKEAGLFVPSGTMGNLASILTHCERGGEIILGNRAHTFLYEVGGIAALGGIHSHTIPNQPDGTFLLDDVENAIRGDNIHFPPTRLITLENTHNRCGGAALSVEYTHQVGELAARYGLKIHLDGARIFNAAAVLDVEPAALVAPVDSVMFCLSKGLGAPVGSIICGSADFIERARKTRKMLGGGMRQVGVIAAAGIYALEHIRPRLIEDHKHAQHLAAGLKDLSGIQLNPKVPATNMVYLDLEQNFPGDEADLIGELKKRGVLIGLAGPGRFRLVTHLWIGDQEVKQVIQAFQEAVGVLQTSSGNSD